MDYGDCCSLLPSTETRVLFCASSMPAGTDRGEKDGLDWGAILGKGNASRQSCNLWRHEAKVVEPWSLERAKGGAAEVRR